jgi:predicted nucleic acid-binding protein
VILVDASIWIDHLRADEPSLAALLQDGDVLMHPFVLGEVMLGALPRREATFRWLRRLPPAVVANTAEVLRMIEAETLFGTGVGYVDAHLLAATRLTAGALLWTRDRRLAAVASRPSLAWGLPH